MNLLSVAFVCGYQVCVSITDSFVNNSISVYELLLPILLYQISAHFTIVVLCDCILRYSRDYHLYYKLLLNRACKRELLVGWERVRIDEMECQLHKFCMTIEGQSFETKL